MDLSFDLVKRKLAGMRQVNYSEAVHFLQSVRVTTTSAAMLGEYAPQVLDRLGGVRLLEPPSEDLTPLQAAAYDVLSGLFPCNADALYEDFYNGEDVPQILIDPVFNMSDDEFGEYVDDPTNFGDGPLTSLLVFIRYLVFVIDAPFFERAAEHFAWSVDVPECCTTTNGIDRVDTERFYQLLLEHFLVEFVLPFQCVAQEIGNMFLDWTLDEVYNEYIPYTMESIHDLVDEWASAQPRLERIKAAAERFKSDRWIAPKIIELWDRCVRYKDGRAPRTLVELWGGDPGNDEGDDDD